MSDKKVTCLNCDKDIRYDLKFPNNDSWYGEGPPDAPYLCEWVVCDQCWIKEIGFEHAKKLSGRNK